jgi:hypothetical protein
LANGAKNITVKMTTLGPMPPHGPDVAGTHPQYEDIHDMNPNERDAFDKLLRPDDCFTPEGVYWADLPISQRIGFVLKSENVEAKKELSELGAVIKADPLAPVGMYFKNYVLPGAGLLLEGCVSLLSHAMEVPILTKLVTSCSPSAPSSPSWATPSRSAGRNTRPAT